LEFLVAVVEVADLCEQVRVGAFAGFFDFADA
jgi:hypothetical protein